MVKDCGIGATRCRLMIYAIGSDNIRTEVLERTLGLIYRRTKAVDNARINRVERKAPMHFLRL